MRILLNFFFCTSLLAIETNYLPIFLENKTWYIKSGFETNYLQSEFSPVELGFIEVNKFPILPNRIFQIPISNEVHEFTLITDFSLEVEKIELGKELAFLFSGIGETWAVYLNGQLIQDEFGLSADNKIQRYRTLRNAKIAIPYGLLRPKNRLVIRLAGHAPASAIAPNLLFGLRFNKGYILDYENNITEKQYKISELVLNSIYIFFGFYHLFFFIRMPKKKYNFYFGIFSIFISVYFLAFSYFSLKFIQDTRILFFLSYTVQPLALFSFLMFLKDYFYPNLRLSFFYKYILVSNLSISLLYVFLPINYYFSLLYIWYILAIPQILYIFYFILSLMLKSVKDSILMGASISIVLLAVVWEILDTVLFNTGILIFQYVYFLFILSLVFILANRFIEINLETIRLNLELTQQKNSFFKFVPIEFLEALEKNITSDIQPGECKLQEKTILFADIRNFTSLSEVMKPEESFQFINSYLNRMGPIIQENDGFIDKFIGDAIMAIFSKPESALRASSQILDELRVFNFHLARRSSKPIEIGIGINTGMLMLGTVGYENRLNTTVIGDTVNIASRLESLTKVYKAKILLSEFTYEKLSNFEKVNIRWIDTVMVKGKKEKIKIYEFFLNDPPNLVELKKKSKTYLEKFLEYKEQNQISKEKEILEVLKLQFSEDPVVEYHLTIQQKLAV